MGLFKPYQRDESEAKKSTPASSESPSKAAIESPQKKVPLNEPAVGPAQKKKIPTPTRREAEQQRRERLKPTLNPKQAKKREREQRMEKRGEAMRKVDAEPRRVLLRNYIDARRSVSQWAMPIIMVCLAVSMFAANWGATAVSITAYLTWAVFAAIIIDVFLLWRGFKKLLSKRLPSESTKGLLNLAINRAINVRRIRTPPPAVKPGEQI